MPFGMWGKQTNIKSIYPQHVYRHVGIISLVYRPFVPTGQVINPAYSSVPRAWMGHIQHLCGTDQIANLSVKELLSWDELGEAADACPADVTVRFLVTWLPGTFCPILCLAALFTGLKPRRCCFRGGDAPVRPATAVLFAFLHNFDAATFFGCSGTSTAARATSPAHNDCTNAIKIACLMWTNTGNFVKSFLRKLSIYRVTFIPMHPLKSLSPSTCNEQRTSANWYNYQNTELLLSTLCKKPCTSSAHPQYSIYET